MCSCRATRSLAATEDFPLHRLLSTSGSCTLAFQPMDPGHAASSSLLLKIVGRMSAYNGPPWVTCFHRESAVLFALSCMAPWSVTHEKDLFLDWPATGHLWPRNCWEATPLSRNKGARDAHLRHSCGDGGLCGSQPDAGALLPGRLTPQALTGDNLMGPSWILGGHGPIRLQSLGGNDR